MKGNLMGAINDLQISKTNKEFINIYVWFLNLLWKKKKKEKKKKEKEKKIFVNWYTFCSSFHKSCRGKKEIELQVPILTMQ